VNDSEIARRTGIPRRTVCDWRRGRSRGKRQTFDVGGVPRSDYAYLLGLYLGDGCISKGPSKGSWRLRITLDNRYPGIIDECQAAMEAVMPRHRCARVPRRGCTEVAMYSKDWPLLFPQHGPGRKHLRPIMLEDWQRAVLARHRKALLRGLVHSDGCRYVATDRSGGRVYRYPRYNFSNRSEDIKRLFCESCDALGIDWRRAEPKHVFINRRASVALLDSFIGPKR
jgi:hypothetical protein